MNDFVADMLRWRWRWHAAMAMVVVAPDCETQMHCLSIDRRYSLISDLCCTYHTSDIGRHHGAHHLLNSLLLCTLPSVLPPPFACQVSANSVYGFTGATVGKMPCLAISASTTAYGRTMIMRTRELVTATYCRANGYEQDCEVIYGDTDSVMVNFKVGTGSW